MTTRNDDIYVGYLPVPNRYATALRVIIPILIGSVVGLGVALAATMGPAGTGVWDMTETVGMTGVVREEPYPYLETEDGPVLLVEIGKFGTSERVGGLDGRRIRVEGTVLSRGEWRAIELTSLEPLPDEPAHDVVEDVGRTVTVTGEIVDSKCYFGAMKPGDGRTHKACAILCIRGGIAPVFVGQTDTGEAVVAVVTDGVGQPMPESMLGFVGAPITLTGKLGGRGALPILRVAEESVRVRR